MLLSSSLIIIGQSPTTRFLLLLVVQLQFIVYYKETLYENTNIIDVYVFIVILKFTCTKFMCTCTVGDKKKLT